MEVAMRIRVFRNPIPILAVALGLLPAALGAAVVESRWAAEPPRIDGQAADWSEAAFSAQKSLGVDLAFRNDADNLYVLVIFKDPRYLSSMEFTGITVYFSPAPKKLKDFGIRFLRKNATPDELIARLEKQGEALTAERKAEIKAKPLYYLFDVEEVDKKGEVISAPVPSGETEPPAFRLAKSQEGFLVYELRVPLASRDVFPAGISSGPGQLLKLGFEWGGMTKEVRAAMMSREQMPDQSQVSGEDARGERAENESAGTSPSLARSAQGPKQYSFWIDLKLAQAPVQ
jgi:hypothetical protein